MLGTGGEGHFLACCLLPPPQCARDSNVHIARADSLGDGGGGVFGLAGARVAPPLHCTKLLQYKSTTVF